MSADNDPMRSELVRLRESQKMVCEMLGHDWQYVRPKPGTAMSAIIGEHVLCVRCGKLNR